MEIKTSSNEGYKHIELKKKVIEILRKRHDIISIDTEVSIKSKPRGRTVHADVCAKKEAGTIYAEVKTTSELFSAINQLKAMDDGNINNEFILVCNFDDMQMVKKVLRLGMDDMRPFINKTQIYNFDKDFNLIYKDIYINKIGEVRIGGKREI